MAIASCVNELQIIIAKILVCPFAEWNARRSTYKFLQEPLLFTFTSLQGSCRQLSKYF